MYNIFFNQNSENQAPFFRSVAFTATILSLIFIYFISFSADGSELFAQSNNRSNNYYYQQFQEVFQRIERDYVQEPNRDEMLKEGIDGMLKSLDPYSGYFTAEDFDFFVSQTDGEFGGIGVEIIPDSGAVKIITPIDDLPAYKAGIKAGDYIIGVNGRLVSTMGFNKAVQEMRGKAGTKVNLLVTKEKEGKTEEIEIIREIVKIKPVKYELAEEEFGGIAYIRLVAFNHQTSDDLKKTINLIEQELRKKDKLLRGIIIDVRSNPGGLFDQATAISEYFLDQGVIVSIKGRNAKNNRVISASKFGQKAPKVPLIILINGGTASAAEIFAGALKYHQRALIMGTTSYGKGLVQTFTQIGERAAVKLTTAKYYTPDGKSINGTGIEPDIYLEPAKVEFNEEKEEDKKIFTSASVKYYLEKYNNEETARQPEKESKEQHHLPMLKKYQADYQYARAYDLIRGLIIQQMRK